MPGRVLRSLAYIVAVLAFIDVAITLVAAYGVVPSAREVVVVEAPLYARSAIHRFLYQVDFDSGVYRVSFYSESEAVIIVNCPFPEYSVNASLGPGEVFEAEIPCRTGIAVGIIAYLEPLQGSVGVMEVSRRWALPGLG